MILQALTQYYERKSRAEEGVLPPIGFETKNIPVIVEINGEGKLVQLRINNKDSGYSEYKVPKSVKKTANIVANTLWDTAEYALGIDTRDKPGRVKEQHDAFIGKIKSIGEPAASDRGIRALIKFLESPDSDPESIKDKLPDPDAWDDMMKNPNVTFQLQGDNHPICQRPSVIETLKRTETSKSPSLCLASGEMDEPERLHPSIKGVWGAQSSGANIVSFNLDAFTSFGKLQGLNAPVGKHTSFRYTTALNHLLRKGSEQRFQVGDASTVFWSAEKTDFENGFGTIFGSTPKSIKDDPDKYKEAIKSVFNSVHRGHWSGDDGNQEFYVLGLSPNASRISVRLWIVDAISKIAERVKQHFEDLEIIRGSNNDQEYLPLFLLLVNVAVQDKADNIPPNLGGEVMRSILTGRPYPYSFFAAAIQRCKATQRVNYPRAAIIKAYLNRINREKNREEIKMSLDKENPDKAYRLGRLFAALEKIQEEANPGINATIRDRYYSSASSNPVSVFPVLLKLKNHHLSKLNNPGRKTNFEKLLGEIMNDIPPDLPATLSLQDQGRFAVGYYHQRQDFFTKKPSTEAGESS